MGTELPPQRRAPTGGKSVTPAQAAIDAEARLGKPCFYSGQTVPGLFQCIACRFLIRNRKTLPPCPECGELIWAYMDDGPRPVPEGESAAVPGIPGAGVAPKVEEGVKIEAAPVRVQENVKLEP